ncbi:MAG: rRNA maturation RNase YbeY [Pseudomonadota bacterium]
MQLDCSIETSWPLDTIDSIAQKAAAAVAILIPESANSRLSASLLLSDDCTVHKLNREWRDKDKPTNVLSFPMLSADELEDIAVDGPPILLGDIILAYETCQREADDKQIPLERHITHLIIHGMLHLLGYDHMNDAEADTMEALEIKALASLGLPDPYSHDPQ